jgi:hypothetical protein
LESEEFAIYITTFVDAGSEKIIFVFSKRKRYLKPALFLISIIFSFDFLLQFTTQIRWTIS